jgi:hypothetical protein
MSGDDDYLNLGMVVRSTLWLRCIALTSPEKTNEHDQGDEERSSRENTANPTDDKQTLRGWNAGQREKDGEHGQMLTRTRHHWTVRIASIRLATIGLPDHTARIQVHTSTLRFQHTDLIVKRIDHRVSLVAVVVRTFINEWPIEIKGDALIFCWRIHGNHIVLRNAIALKKQFWGFDRSNRVSIGTVSSISRRW